MYKFQILNSQPQKSFVTHHSKLQKNVLIVKVCLLAILWNLFCLTQASAGNNKKELNHCLNQARIHYDNSRYESAIEWWNKALDLNPSGKDTILGYIEKAQQKMKKRQGKKAFTKKDTPITEERLSPQEEKAPPREEKIPPQVQKKKRKAGKYILQGKKYYCQQRYNWAISEWKTALKLDPGNIEVVEYIEKARARLKERPSERKPTEANMLVKVPAPESPEPVFEKPKKDVLTLDDAIEIGTKNHLPIQVAREQLRLSKFKEKETFRELFPQATVRWDESSGIVSSRNYAGRKYQLKLQHPLYSGGELRYTWEQAKVNLRIAKESYDKTKRDYAIELAKAYYDLVKATKSFEVQDKLLKELERDLSVAKKEFDGGIMPLVEFLNTQSQYNQAYYSYLSSENTLSLAKLNFLQLMNLDRDPAINVKVDTELMFKDYNIDLQECINLAYKNRLDLKINELTLKSAELGETVTRSQQLPKIDLTSTVGKSGEMFAPGKMHLSDDWFVGAKVSVPWGPNSVSYSYTNENIAPSLTVFQPTRNEINSVRFNILDNLASYTEIQRSLVSREQAYTDLLKGKQTAAAQVREAYFNYQESAVKVKNSLANKELYTKELAIMKERRLMSDAQTQDVIMSKVKLATEEANYNSLLVENMLAIEKLNDAIGIRKYFK